MGGFDKYSWLWEKNTQNELNNFHFKNPTREDYSDLFS